METRRLWYVPAGDMAAYLATTFAWRHALCIGIIERVVVTDPRKPPSVEVTTWLLAGVGLVPAPWAVLLALRLHWFIENCIHYRRDVTFDEDRNHARTIGFHLAVARSLTITMNSLQGFRYSTDAQAWASAHLPETLQWLTQPCDTASPACQTKPVRLDTLWQHDCDHATARAAD